MTRSNRDYLLPFPVAGSRSPITLCSPESPGFEMLDFQLPHWVAREVLHYETIPAEPRGALSDLEDREAEADLLASPHPTTAGPQDDDCERPMLPKALPQISLHSAFVSAVADYSLFPFAEGAVVRDGDERKQISLHSAIRVQSALVSAVADCYPLFPFPEGRERESRPHREEATQISMHSAFVSAVTERERREFGAERPARHPAEKRARALERAFDEEGEPRAAAAPVPPKVKFQIPFPAFVPFPPSPTRPAPVFSLSETTPFPFRVAAATSTTCTCRCACADRDAPTAVTVGVQTEFESPSKPFNFSVSVGTQAAPVVSAGTQPDSDSNPTSVETVSVGTQSEKVGFETVSVGTQSEKSPAAATESVGTQSEPVPEEDDRDLEYEFI